MPRKSKPAVVPEPALAQLRITKVRNLPPMVELTMEMTDEDRDKLLVMAVRALGPLEMEDLLLQNFLQKALKSTIAGMKVGKKAARKA
jgi:hypothetical protein